MEKEKIIEEQFKKAIDILTIKDYFFRSPYSLVFESKGRKYKIEKNPGFFFSTAEVEIRGDSPHSQVHIDISISLYNEIDRYMQDKLLTFQYT